MFARAAVIIALLAVAVAYGARTSHSAGHEQTYVVRVGDTLWSIASTHYAGDPRQAVWKMRDRNHIGALLWPGQRLVLP